MAETNGRFALRGVAILALTLFAGVAAGFAMERTVLGRDDRAPDGRGPGGPRQHDRYESALYDQLDLSAEQRARIDSAIERGRRETEAYWARVEPGMRAIVDSVRSEIRSTLTAEQRARYDSLRAERRARRERDRERERERQQEWERRRHGRP